MDETFVVTEVFGDSLDGVDVMHFVAVHEFAAAVRLSVHRASGCTEAAGTAGAYVRLTRIWQGATNYGVSVRPDFDSC